MTNLNDLFQGKNLTDYAAIPFWSWNSELEPDELVRQIRSMKQNGMGGFIMHARTGLSTPYLGEKWMKCIEACLDEAKRLGMNGWIYDENGWPSGFVGGELLKEKENLATYLEMDEGEFNKDAYAVFVREKGRFRRVTEECGSQKYYNVRLCYSPANTDILKPSVVDKFIEQTYQKYYELFSDRFGKELKGFFTDEPQYFRWGTPYTVELEGYFKTTYGEDVRDGLIHIFFDGEEDYPYRVKYYSAMNELYTVNFYKKINDWCEGHGCLLTGHSVEETRHYQQMWGGAGCMPSYEHEGIPGIDNLAKDGTAVLSARQVGSVAAQLGKKQILTETFGCSGYDATPATLRAIAEKQYAHGVNLMCHHLYSYTLAGQAKTDHPPCFSEHMTWGKDFKSFNDYFTRLGYMLAEGKDFVNAAVLSPMTSIYLQYKRFDEKAAMKIDEEFDALQSELAKKNIEYHILDEKLLKKYGSVEGAQLKLGKCAYDYIIIPYSPNVYSATAKLLKEYAAAGGKIFVYGQAPEYVDGIPADLSCLKTNVTLEEVKNAGGVIIDGDGVEYTHRVVDGVDFIFAANDSDSSAKIYPPKDYSEADLLTGEATSIDGSLIIAPHRSALLIKDLSTTKKAPVITQKRDISSTFTFKCADQNTLTIDFIEISFDGKNYSQPRYVYDVFNSLVRDSFKGDLWVKYTFNSTFAPTAKLMIERNKGEGHALNGHALTFTQSAFDSKFEECDVTPYIKSGVNEFTYKIYYFQQPIVRYALFDPEATESVRNCLTFDTEIEQIYLIGDFSVQDRVVCPPASEVALSDILSSGYPHFAGAMTFEGEFEAKGGDATVTLAGNYMSAALTVNGKEYSLTLDNKTVIQTLPGKNKATLTFTASLRNMIGPLHCKLGEAGVGPYHFRIPGGYDDPENTNFTKNYNLKPVGITEIILGE